MTIIQPSSQTPVYPAPSTQSVQASSSTVFLSKNYNLVKPEETILKTSTTVTPRQPQISQVPQPYQPAKQNIVSSATVGKRDNITRIFSPLLKNETKTTYESTAYYQQPNNDLKFQSQLTPPRITRKLPAELRKQEGQVAKFEFNVTGNPEPEVYWYKDNMLLKNTPDTRLTSESGLNTLVIPEIFPEDCGMYKVVVRNPLGVEESICRLIVEG